MSALSVNNQNRENILKEAYQKLEGEYLNFTLKNRFELGCGNNDKKTAHYNILTKICKWGDYELEEYIKEYYGEPKSVVKVPPVKSTIPNQPIKVVSIQRIYFGGVTTIPTTEAQYKALPQNVVSTTSTLDLITGITNLKFVISVPQGVVISEIRDLYTNYRVEDEFLALPDVTITDSNGKAVVHKNYALQNGIPYNPSTRFRITFSNS